MLLPSDGLARNTSANPFTQSRTRLQPAQRVLVAEAEQVANQALAVEGELGRTAIAVALLEVVARAGFAPSLSRYRALMGVLGCGVPVMLSFQRCSRNTENGKVTPARHLINAERCSRRLRRVAHKQSSSDAIREADRFAPNQRCQCSGVLAPPADHWR
jgi:hypothetical protein